MSPGGRNRGSCTSKIVTGPPYAAAASSHVARSSSPQLRRVSESSQVPITLVRKRVRPSTPPSLVKLAARASSVSTGRSSSTPTSPQVPHETYAASGSVIGTPTTAEAVSWEPTATTGVPSCLPITVPGSTSSGSRARSRPTSASSSASQSPVRTSSRPVVEALVRSHTFTPVRADATRSGISSSCSASPSRVSAASW